MLVSNAELTKAYVNSLRALGLSYGVAVDAAVILRWFDESDFGGIGRFFRFHNRLATSMGMTGKVARRVSEEMVEIDMQGAALPVVAPAAVDFGIARFRREGKRHLQLKNLTGIGLACGLLNFAHIRNQPFSFHWLDKGGDSGRYYGAGRVQFETGTVLAEGEIGTLHLEFSEQAPTDSSNFGNLPKVFDGVEVDDQNWARLVLLAKEILVPESEESRLRGAGQGADE